MTVKPTISRRQRWTFLAVLSLGLFLVGADNSILYTALPELREQLNTTPTQGLWIINAYPLVLVGLLLGSGTLGDKIGHRLMFLIGVVVFGAGSLLAAFSPTAWILVGARGLLGVGAATLLPSTLALIRITFQEENERNVAIAIWGSVAVVGAAAGPVLGGFLLQHFWWGSVFLINVPVVVLLFFATLAVAPPNIAQSHRHWDLTSSIWALITMMGIVTAIKELTNPDRNLWLFSTAVVATGIGGWLFLQRQKKLEQPLLEFGIFKNRIFSGGVAAATMMMFVLVGVELMTTQRFQLTGGFTPFQAGLLVAAAAVPAIPMAVVGGATLHKVGFIPLISGGFFVMAIGIIAAVIAFNAESLNWFIACLVLVGVGGGLVSSVSSTAMMGAVRAEKAGMASSVDGVSYELGTLFGVAVLGSLLPMIYSRHAPTQVAYDPDKGIAHEIYGRAASSAYDDSYVMILLITAGVAVLSAILTAVLFRGNPKSADELTVRDSSH